MSNDCSKANHMQPWVLTLPSAHFVLVSSGPATKGWDCSAVPAFMDCRHKSNPYVPVSDTRINQNNQQIDPWHWDTNMWINIYWYVCRSAQHLGETVADDMHNEKQSVRPHHSWLKGQDKGKLESQLLRHGAIHPRCPHNIGWSNWYTDLDTVCQQENTNGIVGQILLLMH